MSTKCHIVVSQLTSNHFYMSQYCSDMAYLLFSNNVKSQSDVKIHAGHCRKCGYLLQNGENAICSKIAFLSECVHSHEPMAATPLDKKA